MVLTVCNFSEQKSNFIDEYLKHADTNATRDELIAEGY